ncbi:MAG: lycopene cyclase family protein [Planctomycetota bacterium]
MTPTSIGIAGGGCAGPSLARDLLNRFPDVRLTVIEPKTAWANDRTWCTWRFDDTPDQPAETHRWMRMRVRGGGFDTELDISAHPYIHIPSGGFFEDISACLARSGRCRIVMGATAESMSETEHGVVLEMRNGHATETLRFEHVFDGRPISRDAIPSDRSLIQHFLGQEVEFDSDVLQPDVATVMDFEIDQTEGLAFMYVLPFSSRRALLEATFMTPPSNESPDYEYAIERYCDREFGTQPARVLRRECGGLPMTTASLGPESSNRIWQIGTRAGIARASTGYAFDAIQRDSRAVCDALERGTPRPRPPRPRLLGHLDAALLSLLVDTPAAGPEIFGRLFSRAPTSSLLRFLNDRPSVADTLAVTWAMPKPKMIRHLLAHPSAIIP